MEILEPIILKGARDEFDSCASFNRRSGRDIGINEVSGTGLGISGSERMGIQAMVHMICTT